MPAIDLLHLLLAFCSACFPLICLISNRSVIESAPIVEAPAIALQLLLSLSSTQCCRWVIPSSFCKYHRWMCRSWFVWRLHFRCSSDGSIWYLVLSVCSRYGVTLFADGNSMEWNLVGEIGTRLLLSPLFSHVCTPTLAQYNWFINSEYNVKLSFALCPSILWIHNVSVHLSIRFFLFPFVSPHAIFIFFGSYTGFDLCKFHYPTKAIFPCSCFRLRFHFRIHCMIRFHLVLSSPQFHFQWLGSHLLSSVYLGKKQSIKLIDSLNALFAILVGAFIKTGTAKKSSLCGVLILAAMELQTWAREDSFTSLGKHFWRYNTLGFPIIKLEFSAADNRKGL